MVDFPIFSLRRYLPAILAFGKVGALKKWVDGIFFLGENFTIQFRVVGWECIVVGTQLLGTYIN